MATRVFNIHDIVLVITAFQLFLLAMLLFFKQEGRQTNHYLLAGFLMLNGIIPFFMLAFYGPIKGWGSLSALVTILPFLAIPFFLKGPVLYWYLQSLIHNDFAFKKRDSIHLIPLVMFVVTMIYLYKDPITRNIAWKSMTWFVLIQYIVIAGYGFVCLRKINKYESLISSTFANSEKVDFIWLRLLIGGFFIIWIWGMITRLVAEVALNFQYANMLGLIEIYVMFILVNMLLFFNLGYASIFSRINWLNSAKDQNKSQINLSLIGKLERVMKDDKPYLMPDITVEGLASQLEVSAKELSTITNRHYNQNFFEFINSYRIEEAKKLLQDPQNKSKPIQEIYEKAGFNSKSTFNALFKKMAGITPREYRKIQSE